MRYRYRVGQMVQIVAQPRGCPPFLRHVLGATTSIVQLTGHPDPLVSAFLPEPWYVLELRYRGHYVMAAEHCLRPVKGGEDHRTTVRRQHRNSPVTWERFVHATGVDPRVPVRRRVRERV